MSRSGCDAIPIEMPSSIQYGASSALVRSTADSGSSSARAASAARLDSISDAARLHRLAGAKARAEHDGAAPRIVADGRYGHAERPCEQREPARADRGP